MADEIVLPDPSVALVVNGRMNPDWYRLFRLFADSYNSSTSSQETATTALSTQLTGIDKLTTRGDLLTRDASGYTRIPIGSSLKILTSDGTDASWQSPAASGGIETIVATTSLPAAATVDITGIPATYSYLCLYISGASSDTATRAVVVRVSTDNGSNFDSTAGNYIGFYTQSTPTDSNIGTASLVGGPAVAAAVATTISLNIFAYHGGVAAYASGSINSGGTGYTNHCAYLGSTSAINALRIGWNNTGSFDAGTYALYGVK